MTHDELAKIAGSEKRVSHIMGGVAMKTPAPVEWLPGDGKKGQKFNVKRLEKLCRARGLDPCDVAVRALDTSVKDGKPVVDLTDKERIDVALKLMEYLIPKKKAIEHTGTNGGPLQVEIVTFANKITE